MLPDAQDEVGGHAHLQGAVPPAGEEIDGWAGLWIPACAGTTKVMQRAFLLPNIWDDSCLRLAN